MHCFVLILLFVTTAVTNSQTSLFPDCKSGPLSSFPICDQSLSVQQRAVDLVSRMTIEEKANWLSNTVQSMPRLGLPSYQWWNEALHGVMYLKAHAVGVPEATSFPSPLNLAATFNSNLLHRIANIVCRAICFSINGRILSSKGIGIFFCIWLFMADKNIITPL